METITTSQYRSLKRINWDYAISVEDMHAVINGEKSRAGHWTKEDIFIRMLDKLNWYDLLDFFDPEEMGEKLTPDFLVNIHNKEKREKYERLGKILRGETVSFTKWGTQYSAASKNTLFSDRWYST